MARSRARSAFLPAAALAIGLSACHAPLSTAESVSPQTSKAASEHTELTYEVARVIDTDLGFTVAIDAGRGRAFTVSNRKTLRYWDLTTGQMLAEHPKQGSFYTTAISRDLIALEHDNRVSVWRLADGARIASWETPAAALSLSPDGRLLASASPEGQVSVWATDTGELLGGWSGPPDYGLEFGHQGTRLLGVPRSYEPRAREQPGIVWTVPDGRTLATLANAKVILGPYVFAQGDDLEVWRAEDGQPWLTMKGRGLGITPDARFAVTRGGSVIRRYSLTDRKLIKELNLGSNIFVEDWALSPDGSLLALTTDDDTQVWDLVAGKRRHVLDRGRDLRFSDDGAGLWMHRADQSVVVVDVADGSVLETPLTGYVWPSNERTVYATTDYGIVGWSRTDGHVSAPTAERLRLGGAWISESGQRIVGWFRDGLQIRDAGTGEPLDRCDDLYQPGPVRWLGEDRILVNDYRRIFIVDPATCERTNETASYSDEYRELTMNLAPSPEGGGIALAADGGLQIFFSGGRMTVPDTHFVRAADWARGDLFAVAGHDVIRVLASDGRLIGELGRGPLPEPEWGGRIGNAGLGAGRSVPAWSGSWNDVAFDGSRVAVVDDDTLALFDLHTGKREAEAALEPGNAYSRAWIAFDPSGRWLTVSATVLGELLSVRVYSMPDLTLVWSHGRLREDYEDSPDSRRGSAIAWHPRGHSLVVTMRDDDDLPGPALMIEPGTWKVEKLGIPADEWLGTPSFSADGRRLLIPQGDDRLFVLED